MPRGIDLLHGAPEQAAHLAEFLNAGHHRNHDSQVTMRTGAKHRAQLGQENVGSRERQTYGAQPEGRIHFSRKLEAGSKLVAADVECPQGHRPWCDGLNDGTIELVLLVFSRHRRSVDVNKFGAVEADALGSMV